MANIIEHNFGKADREHARRLKTLLGLLGDMEAEMLANPGKYMEMAGKKIVELQQFIRDLREVTYVPMSGSFDPSAMPEVPQTWNVPKDEWERLKRMETMVLNKALDL